MVSRKIIKKVLVSFLSFACLFSFSGCTKGGDSTARTAYKPIELVWWSVWENEDNVENLINAYTAIHPNVSIEYKKFRYAEYENALLEALAEDRGPDILTLHNTWLKRYKSKIVPPVPVIRTPIKKTTGTVKKEEVYEFLTRNSLTPAQMRKLYLEVVAKDAVMIDENAEEPVEKVWGIPLAMDTLVMYYNRDLLNNVGIVEPPTSWEPFARDVEKITKIDSETGEVLISGTALGTAQNVERSFDILSLLMMQNLTPMTDSNGNAAFNKIPSSLPDLEVLPGLNALNYYLQFASPSNTTYCWNDQKPNSFESFIKGQVGYFFGYMYHYNLIKAQSPKLNLGIAKVPQVGGENQKANYANYWVETVSKKSKNANYAWDFLQFATEESNIETYLTVNKKLPALRSTKLINKALADEILGPSAEQLLTARSWYHGYDSALAEEAFANMVEDVLLGRVEEPVEAINSAVDKVNYSIYAKP
ncbi:MAG: extracellular solute-binding protein [Patescibacteria group bacterium]